MGILKFIKDSVRIAMLPSDDKLAEFKQGVLRLSEQVELDFSSAVYIFGSSARKFVYTDCFFNRLDVSGEGQHTLEYRESRVFLFYLLFPFNFVHRVGTDEIQSAIDFKLQDKFEKWLRRINSPFTRCFIIRDEGIKLLMTSSDFNFKAISYLTSPVESLSFKDFTNLLPEYSVNNAPILRSSRQIALGLYREISASLKVILSHLKTMQELKEKDIHSFLFQARRRLWNSVYQVNPQLDSIFITAEGSISYSDRFFRNLSIAGDANDMAIIKADEQVVRNSHRYLNCNFVFNQINKRCEEMTPDHVRGFHLQKRYSQYLKSINSPLVHSFYILNRGHGPILVSTDSSMIVREIIPALSDMEDRSYHDIERDSNLDSFIGIPSIYDVPELLSMNVNDKEQYSALLQSTGNAIRHQIYSNTDSSEEGLRYSSFSNIKVYRNSLTLFVSMTMSVNEYINFDIKVYISPEGVYTSWSTKVGDNSYSRCVPLSLRVYESDFIKLISQGAKSIHCDIIEDSPSEIRSLISRGFEGHDSVYLSYP